MTNFPDWADDLATDFIAIVHLYPNHASRCRLIAEQLRETAERWQSEALEVHRERAEKLQNHITELYDAS